MSGCVCVCVLLRDQTRHPTRPTLTAPASPVLGFISLNKGVGSCIPSYGPGGVCGGQGSHAIPSAHARGRSQASRAKERCTARGMLVGGAPGATAGATSRSPRAGCKAVGAMTPFTLACLVGRTSALRRLERWKESMEGTGRARRTPVHMRHARFAHTAHAHGAGAAPGALGSSGDP